MPPSLVSCDGRRVSRLPQQNAPASRQLRRRAACQRGVHPPKRLVPCGKAAPSSDRDAMQARLADPEEARRCYGASRALRLRLRARGRSPDPRHCQRGPTCTCQLRPASRPLPRGAAPTPATRPPPAAQQLRRRARLAARQACACPATAPARPTSWGAGTRSSACGSRLLTRTGATSLTVSLGDACGLETQPWAQRAAAIPASPHSGKLLLCRRLPLPFNPRQPQSAHCRLVYMCTAASSSLAAM